MNLNGQDWDQVVLRKNKPKPGTAPKKEAAVNEALRTGGQVEAVKKFGAGANKITGTGKDAAKLDRETEELHHDRCSPVFGMRCGSQSSLLGACCYGKQSLAFCYQVHRRRALHCGVHASTPADACNFGVCSR